MTTLATDAFTRANGALGASWTNFGGFSTTIVIVSNRAAPAAFATAAALYNAVTWPNNQWSQVTLTTVWTTSDEGMGPAVRMNSAGPDLYLLQPNTTETRVYKCIGGSFTKLGTDGPACANNDVLYLEIQGTTIIAKRNGTSICGSPITDASLSTGSAGLFSAADTAANVDDWSGGDFVAAGSQPSTWQSRGGMGAIVSQ